MEGITSISGERWDGLVQDASPFLEYGFLSALEETGCVGGETGWQPHIITASQNGKLVGALPLYFKTHSQGEFVFDWSWADAAHQAGISYYPKGVVAVPFTPVTGSRLLVHPDVKDRSVLKKKLVQAGLDAAADAGLSSMHFNFFLPEEADVFRELELPLRVGLQYHWKNANYRGFEDYLRRFRAKRRGP